MISFIADKLHK